MRPFACAAFALLLTAAAVAQTKPSAAFHLPPRASGSKDAPLVIDVFSDFECPHCGDLYTKVLTRVIEDYCDKGKVYLIHHDFPLPQHAYAPKAALWADAAATVGKYEVVAGALFEKQPIWVATGDVEKVVSDALPPAEFRKVKLATMEHKDAIESAIQQDVALGHEIQLDQTPTMRITYKGKVVSQTAGSVAYSILKRYLDDQLAK